MKPILELLKDWNVERYIWTTLLNMRLNCINMPPGHLWSRIYLLVVIYWVFGSAMSGFWGTLLDIRLNCTSLSGHWFLQYYLRRIRLKAMPQYCTIFFILKDGCYDIEVIAERFSIGRFQDIEFRVRLRFWISQGYQNPEQDLKLYQKIFVISGNISGCRLQNTVIGWTIPLPAKQISEHMLKTSSL